DDNFTHMPVKIAIELERQLNTSKNSRSNEENIESETVSLVRSIETKNIEHETEKEISQINDNSILIPCAIIDHIDSNIKKCGSTNKLYRLWQLVRT
ncbi:8978_t:CDS:1, partial [Funneliformis geosporum]